MKGAFGSEHNYLVANIIGSRSVCILTLGSASELMSYSAWVENPGLTLSSASELMA